MTVTRDLAADLAKFASGCMPDASARDATLNDLIDTLACAAAGRAADGVTHLRGLFADWGGKPEAGVWFDRLRLPAPEAAFVNGVAAHAVEFDDTHDEAIVHAGITVVPAVLAAAERRGEIGGDELLAAVVVGVDVACRLALGVTAGPGESGWLLTPLCGTFGAAAGAARALGLDFEQTLHALGLAYAQAAGNGQATIDGALAKRLQAGLAARAAARSPASAPGMVPPGSTRSSPSRRPAMPSRCSAERRRQLCPNRGASRAEPRRCAQAGVRAGLHRRRRSQ